MKRLRHRAADYTTADLESPLAELHFDVLQIPLPDASYDVLICNHLLEHVADDRRALGEFYRILRPGGWGILLSPVDRSRAATFEDDSITDPAERTRIFGQYDHRRIYGRDYGGRLREAGTMRPVSARRSGGATHCPTTGSTSCAGPFDGAVRSGSPRPSGQAPDGCGRSLAGRHRMNVWLEKSVCLISTLEWNNLPPPRFFCGKSCRIGKLFRIFVITNPKPPSLMERSRRRVLSPMPMGPIRRSGRPRHLPPPHTLWRGGTLSLRCFPRRIVLRTP